MDGPHIALAFALTSVPAFLIARSLHRAGPPGGLNPLLGKMMRVVGLLMLGGALGMLWAGDSAARVLFVALGMAVAVNAMAVAMFIAVVRRRRPPDGRP